MTQQQIIEKLWQCKTQDDVDSVIRQYVKEFADDKKLNNEAYKVRYRIEANRMLNR